MIVLDILLAILAAALWQRVRDLNERVTTLEGAQSLGREAYVPTPMPPAVGAADRPRPAEADRPLLAPPEPAGAALRLERVTPAAAAPVAPSGPHPAPAPPERARPAATAPVEPRRAAPVAAVPVAPSEPHAAPAPTPAPARAGLEELFGRRLATWAGGATLAVSGFLVVRWSVEAGLLAPAVRVCLGLVFAALLVAGAEAARRFADRVRDPRVAQALAGAGVATAYAAILAAANLYGLVAPGVAFAGLAATTVLAAALSLRFGAPSAVLGLLGGLAAPALVGSDSANVPLLALYLALAVGGLAALGRRQGWWWLAAAALAGGFGWGALLIAGSVLDARDAAAVGLYAILLGIGVPLLAGGVRSGLTRLAGAAMGAAQVAALVATGGFAPLSWGMFGLVAAGVLWLSRREPAAADLPLATLAVGALLAAAWPHPAAFELAAVLAGLAALHLLPAALRVWRTDARVTDAPLAAAAALAAGLVPALHFGNVPGAALLGAVLAAGVAAPGWRCAGRREDPRFATLSLTAAVLLAAAAVQGLVPDAQPPALAVVTLGLALLARAAGDRRVERGAWAFAAATLALLLADRGTLRLGGWVPSGGTGDLARWAVPAAVAALLARLWSGSRGGAAAQGAAALLLYGAAAQMLPFAWLAPAAAVVLAGTAALRRIARPALFAAAAPALGWAAAPALGWLVMAAGTALGIQAVLTDWPAAADALLRLGLPGLALLAAALVPTRGHRLGSAWPGAVLAMVAAHVLFQQPFAIRDAAGFAARAMAERTLWEALLAAAALGAWRLGARRVATMLGAASLAHFSWYTLGVANPLFVPQAPGPWLAAGLALATALLVLAPRALPNLARQRDWALMALAVLGGPMLLRQAFGPMPLALGTTGPERIAYSLTALALAGAFLAVGVRRRARDWRLAGLWLMLAAVAKVFLADASGLDGLARIASFAALGFALIAVGWLYNRLPRDADPR